MDARKARAKSPGSTGMDLHAQMHFARGRERGSMHWMIRGRKLQMMADARLREIVLGRGANT